jgi:hypothetical protein
MRVVILIPILLVAALPERALPNPPIPGPSAATEPNAAEANAADWADWDAQARITDGDYDGAVQAEQLAQAARKQADELATRATKRPASRP